MKLNSEWLINELKIAKFRFDEDSSNLNRLRMTFLGRLLSYVVAHDVMNKPMLRSDIQDIQVLSYMIFDDLFREDKLLRHDAEQLLDFLLKLPGYSEQTARMGEIPAKAAEAYNQLIFFISASSQNDVPK